MFCALTSTLTSLGIICLQWRWSTGCQNVTGVCREDLKERQAGVGKQKRYQTWYGIPCGQGQDNGERESALFLINTEHKALRCNLRHFARPPSGTGRRAAKHSQSRAANSALQMENMKAPIFPDETLPVDRKYATDGNSFSSLPAVPTCWPLTPPPCTVIIQNAPFKQQKISSWNMQLWQSNEQTAKKSWKHWNTKYFSDLLQFHMLSGLMSIWPVYISISMSSYWQQYCLSTSSLAAGGRATYPCWDWLGKRMEQNVNSFVWRYKEKWIGTTSCFYSEREKKHEPATPTTASPPFLYFFASFAILFTTQEYTHQSPGGASWMRAEIQCAHYAVKSIVSHHSLSWVAFVLFKCLHGTAQGLEDRCMVQEYCSSTILLFPGWK